jgi:hypothetical protein
LLTLFIFTEYCFPKDVSRTFAISTGVWAIVMAITGILGNLLTLLAIPYAAKHRRLIFSQLITPDKIRLISQSNGNCNLNFGG